MLPAPTFNIDALYVNVEFANAFGADPLNVIIP